MVLPLPKGEGWGEGEVTARLENRLGQTPRRSLWRQGLTPRGQAVAPTPGEGNCPRQAVEAAGQSRRRNMKTSQHTTNRDQRNEHPYTLHRKQGVWELTFKGRQGTFKHEVGALYVAFLLTERPRQALHGVALALKARETLGQLPSPAEAVQQRAMGLEDASSVRALWRRQRELERVLEDRLEIEPVKAEALRELEELTERLRQSSWLSCHGAERCAHAVGEAIRRFHARLETAVRADGKPEKVLRAFALHLHEYVLVPSGRGGGHARAQATSGCAGCFTYEPPRGVVWVG